MITKEKELQTQDNFVIKNLYVYLVNFTENTL